VLEKERVIFILPICSDSGKDHIFPTVPWKGLLFSLLFFPSLIENTRNVECEWPSIHMETSCYRSECGATFKLVEFLLESPSHSYSIRSTTYIASLLLPVGASHHR
jgi:hypothetical protein